MERERDVVWLGGRHGEHPATALRRARTCACEQLDDRPCFCVAHISAPQPYVVDGGRRSCGGPRERCSECRDRRTSRHAEAGGVRTKWIAEWVNRLVHENGPTIGDERAHDGIDPRAGAQPIVEMVEAVSHAVQQDRLPW